MKGGNINDSLIKLMGCGWTGLDLLASGINAFRNVWYVDGTRGSDSNSGKSSDKAFATIQKGIDAASAGDVVLIFPKKITALATDPTDYAETLTIANAKSNLALIGVDFGRSQGGLPQIKKGSGSTALLTIRAPGCLIANLGFNGAGSTGGGIKLHDDGGTTYSAFGTTVYNCHFKNCKCHATNGSLGGAIYWADGGAWQVLIKGNRFYKCVADIVVVGTGTSVPQDIVIEDNVFSGPAASVDINIKTGGSGVDGIIIRNNTFPCFPNLSSGTNTKQLDLTGSVGILEHNTFGCTGKTFGAAGNNLVPTTVLMAGNYQETAVGDDNYQGKTVNRT